MVSWAPTTSSRASQARVSSVSWVGSSSGIVTRTSRLASGSTRIASIHAACSRIRPVGTNSVMVRAARRKEAIWPVGGASATTRSYSPVFTSHSTLPIVTISRMAGAAEARASKARSTGPKAANGGTPTCTCRYSTSALVRSTTSASRPGRTSWRSKVRGAEPRWDESPPPVPVMAMASTRRPRRWAAMAMAAETADLPTPPFPETRTRRWSASTAAGVTQPSGLSGMRRTRWPSSTSQLAFPTRA